jgi:hypothetical protein
LVLVPPIKGYPFHKKILPPLILSWPLSVSFYDLGVVDQLVHLVANEEASAGIAKQVEDMDEVHPSGVVSLLLKSIISHETRITIYSYDVREGDHAP